MMVAVVSSTVGFSQFAAVCRQADKKAAVAPRCYRTFIWGARRCRRLFQALFAQKISCPPMYTGRQEPQLQPGFISTVKGQAICAMCRPSTRVRAGRLAGYG